ncbi:MAG TPA: hypothetical protein VHY79_00370 [Rhizomicrobium sp.]|jgi:hypothetical protein|nr:hypothetical protein [Rhizomicrobium sp.]
MTPHQQRETATQAQRPMEVRATPARQGVGGQGVRYVLGIGLALVVIAFAIIYFTNFR